MLFTLFTSVAEPKLILTSYFTATQAFEAKHKNIDELQESYPKVTSNQPRADQKSPAHAVWKLTRQIYLSQGQLPERGDVIPRRA